MTPPTEPTLPPGTRFAHYEIRREIGGGAMGTVYEAWDTSLERSVALKVLRDRIAHDPKIVERFFREARAAARVNHPNLTHIYFVGKQDERAFFTMEYVPGETLEQLAASGSAVPLTDALDLLAQAARGLAAAHAAGVVHRDVKPSNLIRRDDGVLKVADFGLAKSMGGDVGATGGGSLMGTPTFMSPEQCRGREVDVRTDVYALGLVAWFVLCGKPPFASSSLGELLNDQINTPLPSVLAARPDLSPAVDAVLARLCAKDPEARPASMEEVERLLDSLRPQRLVIAPLFARGSAHVVDSVLVVAAGIVSWLVLTGLGALIDRSPIPVPRWVDHFVAPTLHAVVCTAAALAVVVLPELWHQTSLGKYLFELRVVRADGTKPGLVCVALRVLLRYPILVAFPFLFSESIGGYALAAGAALQVLADVIAAVTYFTREGLTLSDVVTRTRVVYRRI